MSRRPAAGPQVLLLVATAAGDPGARAVAAALTRRGASVHWLETARLPAALRLAYRADCGSAGHCGGIALESVDAVWLRAVEPGADLPAMDEAQRTACAGQSGAALWSWLDATDAFVLEPAPTLLSLPAKPGQQRRAARLGLDVPLSLVANDAGAVREFARCCPHGLVGKLVASGAVGVIDAAGERAFPTFEVTLADLERLPGLELAPLLFQERLRTRREVRLTVVGARRFAAAMRPGSRLDLRHDPAALATLHPIDDLPPAVVERVLALLDEMGLDCAAVDLIETVDGRWVFLEVNAPFHFDHVERAGLPVAEAIADLLLGALPSRFEARRRLQPASPQ